MRKLTAIVILAIAAMIVAPATSTARSNVQSVSQIQSTQSPFFQDNFNGSAIDSTKWNSTFATSGLRWCSSTVANHEDAPGMWLNPTITSCQGGSQNPPFGSVSVGGGSATLSAFGSQTFPYIWSGPPGKSSPFPATGNFVLHVKMRYDTITGSGDGFFVNRWSDTDPVGDNPPGGNPRILLIWADSTGLNVQLLGNLTYNVYNEYATHDYVLEYVNGQYSIFVDGFPVLGPVTSSARANTIWMGNPVFTWWLLPHDWSSFSLYQVETIIPQIHISPNMGPVGTKVLVQATGIPTPGVEVTFDDMFIGTKSVINESFTFTMNVPTAQLGRHQIKAVDQFGNAIAAADFVVSPSGPSSLAVTLTVGTVYFPGDTVAASLLVTSNGTPLSSFGLRMHLNLTKPDNSNVGLNVTSIGSGVFRGSYSLPKTAQIGTYSLVVTVNDPAIGTGSALAVFEVKLPWLSSQASTVTVAGVASVATLGIALISWRKGYFKRSAKESL